MILGEDHSPLWKDPICFDFSSHLFLFVRKMFEFEFFEIDVSGNHGVF